MDRSTTLFGRDTHGISGRAWGMVGWMGKMRVFERFSQGNMGVEKWKWNIWGE